MNKAAPWLDQWERSEDQTESKYPKEAKDLSKAVGRDERAVHGQMQEMWYEEWREESTN
jgi:hypothetical protein